jgi:bifunctional DNA-binding transcriptional regulator/antitoxin component of YhaV-PrlF toxin-antitoxin module
MASPSIRVKVDKQGRLVLPHALREGLVDVPGEVLVTPSSDGLLIEPASDRGRVRVADDGMPVLDIGRTVTNAEVLAALDAARDSR